MGPLLPLARAIAVEPVFLLLLFELALVARRRERIFCLSPFGIRVARDSPPGALMLAHDLRLLESQECYRLTARGSAMRRSRGLTMFRPRKKSI